MMTPEQLTGQTQTHLVETVVGQKAFLVHAKVSQDILALKQSATRAGFNLNIASGFRDFERQMTIWNNKMAGKTAILDSDSQPLSPEGLTQQQKVMAILRWSALPGGSRHHWGTDFDLFDRDSLPQDTQLQLEPWEYLTGHQQSFYQWLQENLEQHGFFFPYAQDKGGVAPEPWHISHRATTEQCLRQLTPTLLAEQLTSAPILGKQVVLDQLETIYNQFISNIHQ
ncbi:D,D-carboxypeptidase-related protein [Vibrio orientalis CIP 102891 = ATCC 33934]|uniref:D,D-carboxypeptidase-related protein n=1 Tax=Vibrio orientalis CIP 102891 = ATCC 33934 TaxID=675816 RepID=C9QJC7_VIBOR|nr:M15 family metallopeptidase [Vibrio orientalis]EEX91675.1 D,D-carboxypeptidase-related protein [Vibrio orientalis CIP 102891 = ATCC 33934]EGU45142.1 D,D-carboxypeptidase-related protein [Vibrio orientalis CIP 102891 = ATCC 33934]